MDLQAAFNIMMLIAGTFGGWLMKTIYDSIGELKVSDRRLHERIETLPGIYVRRDDFAAFAGRIEATLGRIETKIDHKVDK